MLLDHGQQLEHHAAGPLGAGFPLLHLGLARVRIAREHPLSPPNRIGCRPSCSAEQKGGWEALKKKNLSLDEHKAPAEGLSETVQKTNALRFRHEIQGVSLWPCSISLILVRSRIVRVRQHRTPGKNGGLPLPGIKALRQAIDHDDQKES